MPNELIAAGADVAAAAQAGSTIGQRLFESLIVTATGIAIVFFGLIILIGLIKVLTLITSGMGKKKDKKAKKAAAAAPVVAPAPEMDAPTVDEEVPAVVGNEQLIAVITAAVACMMEDGSAFTVRRVRRVNNTPAWQKAGREEQIYSRF